LVSREVEVYQTTYCRTGHVSFFFMGVFRTNVLSLFVLTKLTKQLGLKNDSCPGRLRSSGRPSRGSWAVLPTNRVAPAGTRTATLSGGITAQHWGGKVDASFCKNRDSGGLVG